MMNLNDVTRLEIIDSTGRTFGRYDLDGVQLSGQDEGRTLKVFLDYDGEGAVNTFTAISAALFSLTKDDPDVQTAIDTLKDHLDEIAGDNHD